MKVQQFARSVQRLESLRECAMSRNGGNDPAQQRRRAMKQLQDVLRRGVDSREELEELASATVLFCRDPANQKKKMADVGLLVLVDHGATAYVPDETNQGHGHSYPEVHELPETGGC
ncbi:hypothetical protein PG996_009296 [Apiospora saccharicola]|uniref:Uncharacterized protein n=1 Tax=Apiospora saccharicola TaxID=335842 RepID=A0ABR1UKC6_9PEZI